MPLLIPSAPPGVMTAFTDGLPMFLSGPNYGLGGNLVASGYIRSAPVIPSLPDVSTAAGPDVHDPQEVFVLNLTAAGTFGAPVSTYWRVFAGTRQFSTVMGRVTQRPPTNPWKMTSAYYGDPVAGRDRVWAACQILDDIRLLPEVRAEDYNLRVLKVPMLNLESFWLVHTVAGLSDLVVPFPAAPNQSIPALNTAFVYSMGGFLSRILPLAKRLLITPPYSGA